MFLLSGGFQPSYSPNSPDRRLVFATPVQGMGQCSFGGRNRIRTYDLLGQNQALYRLSYAAIWGQE